MKSHLYRYPANHPDYLFLVLEFDFQGTTYKAAVTESVLYDGTTTGDYKVLLSSAGGTLTFDIGEFEDEGDLSINPIPEIKQLIREELHKLGR